MGMGVDENTAFRQEYFGEIFSNFIMLMLCLSVWFPFVLALWSVNDMWPLFLAFEMGWGMICIMFMLKIIRFRKPVLVLTQQGLEYPKRVGDEMIQVCWSDIKRIEFVQLYSGRAYVYELGIKLKTPLNRKIAKTIPLYLGQMRGDAHVIHRTILDCWQRYRDEPKH